ncbi:nitrous oxide reductase family maturation protein NosD [Haloferax sp. YSMS24]|uniref:right-handed parallel beta-helix repeat-containing protein n=1 Tax=Haloferax sp. YSMS24 TaxID=3388425 RepID=UPI00398D646C
MITEPGYYVFTKDIVETDAVTVINVELGVSNVTIDGQGYTLAGGGESQYGIAAGTYPDAPFDENVTVKNLTVTGFTVAGITFEEVRNATVHNVKITHCQWGLYLLSAPGLTVSESTIAKNDLAIFQDEGATGATLVGNRITRNGAIGGFDFSSNLRIENNRFDYNGRPLGISFSYGSIVSGNLFYQNDAGLFVDDSLGDSEDAPDVVRENRFIENDRYGIELNSDSRAVLIEENDVFRNGGDGIRVAFIQRSNTVSKNRVIGNARSGILLENADRTEVVGNLIRQNGGDGIELRSSEFSDDGSDDNVVRENIIRENGGLAIRIDGHSTGNVVEDNQIGDDAPDTCRLEDY